MGWKTIILFFGWGKEDYLMTLSELRAIHHQIKGLLLNDKYERICKNLCPEGRERGGGEIPQKPSIQITNYLAKCSTMHLLNTHVEYYHYTNLFGTTRIQLKAEPGIFQ
jgi:hypothetical protein